MIRRTRLANGLTILTEEAHDAPVVALQTWVNVGSADESDDISGIAHLHEHMLFKGTARRGVGEIARTVESAGGEINAWTSFEQTVYHVVMSANETEVGLDILSDALRHSAFDAEELSREIEVVVEEILRAQDSPSRRLSQAIFALAYEKHPYRRPVLGTEASVRSFTRDRIVEFYKANYRPDNVTLVAVGDFETEALLQQIEKYFADWTAAESLAKLPRHHEGAFHQLRARILREDVKETHVALAWQIPGLHHEDIPALDALALVLGGGDSSRLVLETRRNLGLVNDVGVSAYTPRDPGLLFLSASLVPEKLDSALTSLLQETYRMTVESISAAELEKAKVMLLSESAYQRETVQGQARKLGYFEVVGGDYHFETRYLERIKALTPDDLRRAAHRYLTDKPVVVLQLPEKELPNVDTHYFETVVQRAFKHATTTFGRRMAHQAKTAALDVQRLELPNGCTILVRAEKTPVVSMLAASLGGQRWETQKTAGLSHLFSSVWGVATEHLGTDQMAQRVAMLGGGLGAFAGRNSLGLRASFIREKGHEGLDLFMQALLRPEFPSTDLEREREATLERIKNREDNPAGVAFDTFAAQLFPHHPYGFRFSGSEEQVREFSLDDLHAYRERFCQPSQMVVAVVGDIDVEHTLELLAQQLSVGSAPMLDAPLPVDAPPTTVRRITKTLAKAQSHILVGSMGTTMFDERRFALEVLTTVLSGQSGRLFLDLRDQQSLAYSVSSSNTEGLDPGQVIVHIGTSPDKVEQALRGIHGHLERLREELVPEHELQRAQRYLIGSNAIELQRGSARATLMALNERYGLGFASYAQYATHIGRVNAHDVREAARSFLAHERLLEVIVGP